MPPIVIAGAIGAAGSLGGALIGASGAKNAANAQVDAANAAANVSRQNAVDALNFQKQQYNNSLQMLNPYLQTGYGSLGILRNLMGIGGAMPQGFSLNNMNTPSTPPGRIFAGGGDTGNLGALRNPGNGSVAPGFTPMNALSTSAGGNFSVPMANSPTGASGSFSVPTTSGGLPNPDIGSFNAGGNMPSPGFGVPNFEGGPTLAGSSDPGTYSGAPLQVPKLDANGNPLIGPDGNATGGGFGSLITPYGKNFESPTNVTEQNDPGFQFRLDQGMKALQNSAAARGGLLSGGTAKALNDYAQGSASNEYGNVYNRALQNYMTNYNQWSNDQTNQFNRLAALTGMGQTAGNQLSAAGITTGGNIGNTLLTSAGQIGDNLNAAGAARGSGYVGAANALSGGLNNIGNLAMLTALLSQGKSGA